MLRSLVCVLIIEYLSFAGAKVLLFFELCKFILHFVQKKAVPLHTQTHNTMLTFDLDLALREVTALTPTEQLFLLVDESTKKYCLPEVEKTLHVDPTHILCLPAGEEHKNLQTVERVWNFLIDHKANRHSLLLILGGGVLTDLGGFAAATFMRGMPFVNIPTTLLGAVDAGSGGKTGFDYAGIKNQIGVFAQPQQTIIYPPFLQTLPHRQFLSGFAEMLKHALIASPLELTQVLSFDLDHIDWEQFSELLRRSIEIKNYIVDQDPEEQNLRKTLNFGHTIGHALEAYSLEQGTKDTEHRTLLHGEAVAYGLVAELYLSYMRLGFSDKTLRSVTHFVFENFGRISCPCKDYDTLIDLMRHDKKAETCAVSADEDTPQINVTLLPTVGNYRINQLVSPKEIKEALDFLFNQ